MSPKTEVRDTLALHILALAENVIQADPKSGIINLDKDSVELLKAQVNLVEASGRAIGLDDEDQGDADMRVKNFFNELSDLEDRIQTRDLKLNAFSMMHEYLSDPVVVEQYTKHTELYLKGDTEEARARMQNLADYAVPEHQRENFVSLWASTFLHVTMVEESAERVKYEVGMLARAMHSDKPFIYARVHEPDSLAAKGFDERGGRLPSSEQSDGARPGGAG